MLLHCRHLLEIPEKNWQQFFLAKLFFGCIIYLCCFPPFDKSFHSQKQTEERNKKWTRSRQKKRRWTVPPHAPLSIIVSIPLHFVSAAWVQRSVIDHVFHRFRCLQRTGRYIYRHKIGHKESLVHQKWMPLDDVCVYESTMGPADDAGNHNPYKQVYYYYY
jgi:hypothetical protein